MARSNSWTAKDQRKFKHIKKSEMKRGRSSERADQIAGSTVNKQRMNKGMEQVTKDELYKRAQKLSIEGRSKMNKKELLQAIRKHH